MIERPLAASPTTSAGGQGTVLRRLREALEKRVLNLRGRRRARHHAPATVPMATCRRGFLDGARAPLQPPKPEMRPSSTGESGGWPRPAAPRRRFRPPSRCPSPANSECRRALLQAVGRRTNRVGRPRILGPGLDDVHGDVGTGDGEGADLRGHRPGRCRRLAGPRRAGRRSRDNSPLPPQFSDSITAASSPEVPSKSPKGNQVADDLEPRARRPALDERRVPQTPCAVSPGRRTPPHGGGCEPADRQRGGAGTPRCRRLGRTATWLKGRQRHECGQNSSVAIRIESGHGQSSCGARGAADSRVTIRELETVRPRCHAR